MYFFIIIFSILFLLFFYSFGGTYQVVFSRCHVIDLLRSKLVKEGRVIYYIHNHSIEIKICKKNNNVHHHHAVKKLSCECEPRTEL